jgi:hypothetical protein
MFSINNYKFINNKLKMKQSLNYGIFLFLIIINFFFLNECSSIFSEDLNNMEILIESRKGSKKKLEEEYNNLQKKNQHRLKILVKTIREKKKNNRIYSNLFFKIKDIQKMFVNHTSNEKLNNELERHYHVNSDTKLNFFENFDIIDGFFLKDWNQKINFMIDKINQNSDSRYNFQIYKLRQIEQIFSKIEIKETLDNNSSLNLSNFEKEMKNLDLYIQNFYLDMKYISNLPQYKNHKNFDKKMKELEKRQEIINDITDLIKKPNFFKFPKYLPKVHTEISEAELFSRFEKLFKNILVLRNIFYIKYVKGWKDLQNVKKNLENLVKILKEFPDVDYNINERISKKFYVLYSYEVSKILDEYVSKFYFKLTLNIKKSNNIDVRLLKLKRYLENIPFLNKINNNKKGTLISSEDELKKNIKNLKRISEYYLKRIEKKHFFSSDTDENFRIILNPLRKYFETIDREKINQIALKLFNKLNYLSEKTFYELGFIVLNLNKNYDKLINQITTQKNQVKKMEIFFDEIKDSKIIDFLDSEFMINKKDLQINEKLKKINKKSLEDLLEYLFNEVKNIKDKISKLKKISSEKKVETKKYPFEILHTLKKITENPYLFNNINKQNEKKNSIKELNKLLKDLIDDIYEKLIKNEKKFEFKDKKSNEMNNDELELFNWKDFTKKKIYSVKKLDKDINFFENLKEKFQNFIRNETNIDKKYLFQYKKIQKIRNDNKIDTLMKFISNFFEPKKARNILSNLYKKLASKKNVFFRFSTNEKISKKQFSQMRMWSSFRFNKEINKKSIEKIELIDFLKMSSLAYILDLQPLKCWKKKIEERIEENNKIKNKLPSSNTQWIGPILFYCTDDLNKNKDFCPGNCMFFDKKCGESICSKSKCSAEMYKSFYFKNFQNYYSYERYIFEKEKCPEGYVSCDDRSCAINYDLCKIEIPKITKEFTWAIANFLGYIQSMKEKKLFAWTDDLLKYNYTIDELENFYFKNKKMVDLYENYLFTNEKKRKFNSLKNILVQLGFEISSNTIHLSESKEIDYQKLVSVMKLYDKTTYDFDTFNNLRNENKIEMKNIVLSDDILSKIINSDNQNDFSLINNYLKLTIRILKMLVVLKNPKCS